MAKLVRSNLKWLHISLVHCRPWDTCNLLLGMEVRGKSTCERRTYALHTYESLQKFIQSYKNHYNRILRNYMISESEIQYHHGFFTKQFIGSSNSWHALCNAKTLPVSYNTKQGPNNKRSAEDDWIKNLILKRNSYDSPTYITQDFQQTQNGYEARQLKYLTRLLEFEMWRPRKKSLHGCFWIIRVRWRDQVFDNFLENVWEAQGIHFSLFQTHWEHLGTYLEASTPIPETTEFDHFAL